jgi:uncharacterized protein (UPF0276 family)
MFGGLLIHHQHANTSLQFMDERPVNVGLSLMLEPAFIAAALPLLESGSVNVLEWSFDIGWGPQSLPDWAGALLTEYSDESLLYGHGVTFSPLSGQWTDRQADWLRCFAEECELRSYQHVSEHFGFMTAADFHQSAPLPVPMTEATVRLGQERLKQLKGICNVPVGLENLAFAFGLDDVQRQGEFLDRLLEPVDGFLLLDVHNLFCQQCNFGMTPDALLDSYPLERVRELHISGGSWSESNAEPDRGPVRRDTHDQAVPDGAFAFLQTALGRCPNVELVIFERLGDTIFTTREAEQYVADFHKVCDITGTTSGVRGAT